MNKKIRTGNIGGNKGNISFGDNTNNTIHYGDQQGKLVQALKILSQAVENSSSLNKNEKEKHLDVIQDIEKEASKTQPNKQKLKSLTNGLAVALRTIPDIVKAVSSVESLIPH